MLLMKKQITEIEREIIEKSNRTTSATIAGSTSETTTSSSITQTMQSVYRPGSVIPAITVSLSSQVNTVSEKPAVVEPQTDDIDLDSLDPLGN